MDPYFDVIILIAIIINTVTLALDAYPELPGWALNALQILNYILMQHLLLRLTLQIPAGPAAKRKTGM